MRILCAQLPGSTLATSTALKFRELVLGQSPVHVSRFLVSDSFAVNRSCLPLDSVPSNYLYIYIYMYIYIYTYATWGEISVQDSGFQIL